MTKIKAIKAREILDSRGYPTIEVDVSLEKGAFGRAAVPSGASTGKKEALELRDLDPNRFNGKGILHAISSVEKISKHLIGIDAKDYNLLDELMINLDGTENKSVLGANAILAISMAVIKALANYEQLPLYSFLSNKNNSLTLPVPLMNIINGGAHANNLLDIQEFMIMPISATSMKDAIRMGSEVFHSLKKILIDKDMSISVGDEGGFAPNINSTKEALDLILLAIEKAKYKPGEDIVLALDVAASELYMQGNYFFNKANILYEPSQLLEFYENLVRNYPIFSIEDPLGEDDFEGWSDLTKAIGKKVQIVGDDIFVTNKKILLDGINKTIANSILIKPNQIGTISETEQTIKLAQNHDYSTIMSHRSGETEDTTITHLSVAYGCNQIKTGSLCRTDRVAKYNELIRIEENCGNMCSYTGKTIMQKYI